MARVKDVVQSSLLIYSGNQLVSEVRTWEKMCLEHVFGHW